MFGLRDAIRLVRNRFPGQLVIQITDRCNAHCPQCGMRSTKCFERSDLTVSDIRRLLDAAAERGVRAVSFTGGEPLLRLDDLVLLIRHAGSVGIPLIRTGTNGFHLLRARGAGFDARVSELAARLADTPLWNFWISLDSAEPAVHEEMRGFPGVVECIARALPIFHAHGLYPSANLGINRNVGGHVTWETTLEAGEENDPDCCERFDTAYRDAFRRFYRLAADLGFTIVNACYPMSIDPRSSSDDGGLDAVYAATAEGHIVDYRPAERARMYRVLADTIPEFRGRTRIFSPRASLESLARQHAGEGRSPYGCRGGLDYFFVDSRGGNTFPCGYRGQENLGKFWDLDLAKLNRSVRCQECDWECFRDPTELFGPLRQAIVSPLAFWRHWRRDPEFFHLWRTDLAYYRACDCFDGRRGPRYDRMRRFAVPAADGTAVNPPVEQASSLTCEEVC